MSERRYGHRWLVVGAVVLSVGLAACGGGDDGGDTSPPADTQPAGATVVEVTEQDFQITLDATSIPEGSVTFRATNTGPSGHQLSILRTDLAEDALPLTEDGRMVDEEDAGVTVVAEIETFAAGGARETTVTLTPGHYVLICNVPGHYGAGMHTALDVSPNTTALGY